MRFPGKLRVTRAARNLVMDVEDPGRDIKHVLRDQDGKYPGPFDTILAHANIKVVPNGVRMPLLTDFIKRWGRSLPEECTNHVLIYNERRAGVVIGEYHRAV
jgi:hypothetical protein